MYKTLTKNRYNGDDDKHIELGYDENRDGYNDEYNGNISDISNINQLQNINFRHIQGSQNPQQFINPNMNNMNPNINPYYMNPNINPYYMNPNINPNMVENQYNFQPQNQDKLIKNIASKLQSGTKTKKSTKKFNVPVIIVILILISLITYAWASFFRLVFDKIGISHRNLLGSFIFAIISTVLFVVAIYAFKINLGSLIELDED